MITGYSGIHGGRRLRARKEGYALGAGIDKVFRRQIGCPPIVDSNQVVVAAPRIWFKAPVEKYDGNSCSVEVRKNPVVRLVSPL